MATREQLREWGRKGGRARARGCDMRALGSLGGQATVDRHGSDHMADIGAAGWQGLVKKVGVAGAADRLHQWRVGHPSALDRAVMAVLQDLGFRAGIDYEHDAQVCDDPPLYGDFVFHALMVVIEVDGARWHSNDPLHGEDRQARDARKDELLNARGWTVVRLPEAAIAAGLAPDILAGALAGTLPITDEDLP